jgi:hypothetical protein
MLSYMDILVQGWVGQLNGKLIDILTISFEINLVRCYC